MTLRLSSSVPHPAAQSASPLRESISRCAENLPHTGRYRYGTDQSGSDKLRLSAPDWDPDLGSSQNLWSTAVLPS